jgi:hypothetical protein
MLRVSIAEVDRLEAGLADVELVRITLGFGCNMIWPMTGP